MRATKEPNGAAADPEATRIGYMTSQAIKLKLPAALKCRLIEIAEAGMLGSTVEEVILHLTRDALHRDWLAHEAQRAPLSIPPEPRPAVQCQITEPLLQIPERTDKRLLRLPEVCERIGLRRSTLYRMITLHNFPVPRKLGKKTVAWLECDVNAWIDSKRSDGAG